ncbi:MAG: hypothetical protein P8M77_02425 [Porticoccaceae bacterium]|nr:hypothetical protein [Porticoccaceae bacterium]
MAINAKITAKDIIKLFASACIALLLTSPSIAGTVSITYEDTGTSTDGAGAYKLTIDGVTTYAMNAKSKHPKPGDTWKAEVNTYEDVQNGAGNFNRKDKHIKKYNQIGWLFNYVSVADSITTSRQHLNAAINQAVWKIMSKKVRLDSTAQSIYNYATSGRFDDYNWSNSMRVYSGGKFEFFAAARPPIATPIPSAIFLFGSVIIGLFGIVRRKPDLQVSAD